MGPLEAAAYLAKALHDATDESGFVHNCIAHPLWWAVCRPDHDESEGPASLDALLSDGGLDLTVEGRFSLSAGIIKSVYDSENFDHDATLLSIPDEGLDPDVLLTFIAAAAESSIERGTG